MLGGNDQPDLVAMDVDHLKPLLLHRQLGQPEIRNILHHRFDHSRAIGAIDQELDGGEQTLILGEDFRQDVNARRLVGGDHQLSARIAVELVDRVLRATAQVQHLLGVPAENLARGSQRDAASEPFEERRPQLLLELADLCADGRLRTVAGLSGFRKALQPDDFEERMQLVKIHKTWREPAVQTKYESAG